MPSIVAVHSFRRGTGRSHTVANLATLLAARGQRVGVLDATHSAPGIADLFGATGGPPAHALGDFLWAGLPADQVARDVTDGLRLPLAGRIFTIATLPPAGAGPHPLQGSHDAHALKEGCSRLSRELGLDTLLVDTPPGLTEEALLLLAVSDALAVILRLDHQDYQGTAVTIEVARQLEVPRYFLVVNHAPASFDPGYVKQQVEHTYGCDVAAVLPYCEELGSLPAPGAFAVRYPHHPLTVALGRLADRIRA